MQDLTVAAVNFMAETGALEANLERMEGWATRLAGQGVRIACFPELSICGYDHSSRVRQLAQPVPGPATEQLEGIARRNGLTVIAGLAEADPAGKLFISQVAVSPEGLVGVYRKTHLGPFERESFAAGQAVPVFATEACAFGVQLCYDTHFPEVSALQTLQGAEVLFCAFASPHDDPPGRRERLMRYLPARAYDNTCYLVACNLVGRSARGKPLAGAALIFGPKGQLLAEQVGWEEGAAVATLRGGEIERIRRTGMGHFSAHRRPELYGGVCGESRAGRGEAPAPARQHLAKESG